MCLWKKNIKNLSIFGDDVDFLGPTCIIGESLLNQCWVDYFVNVICYNLQLHVTAPKSNHRLRGSASPVLTATHHSYGSLAWLSDFSPMHSPRGQTPQPIITQNGSMDVDSRKDVFCSKNRNWSPRPVIGQNFANFWTSKFFARFAWPLTLEVTDKTPLILHRSSMKVT